MPTLLPCGDSSYDDDDDNHDDDHHHHHNDHTYDHFHNDHYYISHAADNNGVSVQGVLDYDGLPRECLRELLLQPRQRPWWILVYSLGRPMPGHELGLLCSPSSTNDAGTSTADITPK
mmetsp:Transcript_126164/g.306580  ORF Transcript_126164/g.306580 Transcript_126164/m.306580 type:complete len:118 (+) Transcript_126164:807-1160(+)